MKSSNLLTIPVAVALLALGSARAHATVFTVTNLDDTGIGSLRHAILSADIVDGADTVVFQAGLTGTIHLSAFEGKLPIIGDLEIQGPGPAALAVSGDDVTRVFSISAGSTVTISGLSITHGNAGGVPNSGGGGILNSGNLTMTNCILSDNHSGFATNASGGGIFTDGNLTMSNCTLSGNKAEIGGGIHNPGTGTVTLTDCTLSENDAINFGGGISFRLGDVISLGALSLTNCTLSGNTGGGIISTGELTLTHCTFSGNTGGQGGGIRSTNTATLTDCTFFANFGQSRGGGIYNIGPMEMQACTVVGNGAVKGGGIYNLGDLTVTGCTVNGNLADEGGGIFNSPGLPGNLVVENSTLSNNTAFDGGGILNGGTVSLANCTLSGNNADSGGGIHNASTGTVTLGNTIVANSGPGLNCVDDAGGVTSLGHNLDSDGTFGISQPGDQSGTLAASLSPLLGPLQNNGGLTKTHALLPGSPAIDAGDGTLAPSGTDQRGFSRIADGDQNGSVIVDIGAFELHIIKVGLDRAGDLVSYSTVSDLNTLLPGGTDSFNLTIYYSPDLFPHTFVAKLNGEDITDLFDPSVSEGFETVSIPLSPGQNYLSLRVKGKSNGRPTEDVEVLGFRVGDSPFGPR